MASISNMVLLFGDLIDPWYHFMVGIRKDLAISPWLRSFLDDMASVIREQIKDADPKLAATLGGSNFTSIEEIVDMYRDVPEESGFVQCIMSFVMRAVQMLRLIKEDVDLLRRDTWPLSLGVSGGLLAAVTMAISQDFESLRDAYIVAMGAVCRLCKFAWMRSRAVEETIGVWGWAVSGMSSEDLDRTLTQFQNNMGIHDQRRCRVGVRGDRWSTVIGPPSVVKLCLTQCPALKSLAKTELPLRSLQHNCPTTAADHDFIAGNSKLDNHAVHPNFRLFGLDEVPDGEVSSVYPTWKDLLRAIALQAFSKPLDLVRSVQNLDNSLQGHLRVTLRLMGPSCHDVYITGILKKHLEVSIAHGMSARPDLLDTEARLPPELLASRIAVVGMGGRGPGSTTSNMDEFWEQVVTGQDLAEEIPKDRFDADDLFTPPRDKTKEHECRSTCRYGCFLKNPGHFDARFFHISPREAWLMDPGSRLFQMATYEALEMAGYSAGATRRINPARIATFFGQSNDDGYITAHHEKGCDAYTMQTAERAFPAGRVAFHYGWEGATWAVDCACSTGCSMIHLACTDLLHREIDMAVVGAANVLSFPHSWCNLSKSGVLSDTGNCKTFRDDADGYCRGEFVASVVLKRLDDAMAHNDNILAVIAGSGRNQSGNATFITASEQGAQERLFRQVLRDARLTPNDISYVELHGTGTPVGDPVEMRAVANVLKRTGAAEEPLIVGAVKANFGHGEAASGLASLMKCVMMFAKGIMPPQVGMPHALNPAFPPLDNIRILSEPREFVSSTGNMRRILVNNFDAAGGNACLILEDPVAFTGRHRDEKSVLVGTDPRSAHVVATSARSLASLQANRRRLLGWLHANAGARVQDIAYTTTARRIHHPFRFSWPVSSIRQLINDLERDIAASPYNHNAPAARRPPIVFVFTGQGSHYVSMGGELYRTNPIVREMVDMCVRLCAEQGFPPFLDIITCDSDSDSNSFDSTMRENTVQTQLAVVTLEIGLATYWRRIGIEPSLVMGHSLGEYAALHIAGVLSLSDVLYIVGQRAQMVMKTCKSGAFSMLAVSASLQAVQRHIAELDQFTSCGVACINSPNTTVVSGTVEDVAKLQATLKSAHILSKNLPIPYGFHSSQVEPILKDFITLTGGCAFSRPKIPVASGLHKAVIDAPGVFGADYLAQHMRQPVDFVGGVLAAKAALNDQEPVWLEIGPAEVCCAFVRATLSPPPDRVMSTLEVGTSAWKSVSKSMASLYKLGSDIDWLGLHAPFEKDLRLLTLPSYEWDTKDYWLRYTERRAVESKLAATEVRAQPMFTCAQHIVQESRLPKFQVTFSASLAEPGMKALLEGHVMRGIPIMPGSVCCEAGISAALYALQTSENKDVDSIGLAVRNVVFLRPLTTALVGAEGELHTTAIVETNGVVRVSFRGANLTRGVSYDIGGCEIVSHDPKVLQATLDRGSFYIKAQADRITQEAKEGRGHRLQPEIFYSLFSRTVDYQADDFKCVQESYVSPTFDEAVAKVMLRAHPPSSRFTMSPYWGDSLAHLGGFIINHHPSRHAGRVTTTLMCESAKSFQRSVEFEAGKIYLTYARVLSRKGDRALCEVFVFDDDTDRVVMQFSDVEFHEVQNAAIDALRPSSKSPTEGFRPREVLANGAGSQTRQSRSPGNPEPPASKGNTTVVTHLGEESGNTPDIPGNASVLQCILECIAKESNSDIAGLTDDTILKDIGLDSIMAVEIVALVKEMSDFDLPATFLLDYPTVGDLRCQFGSPEQTEPRSQLEPQGARDEPRAKGTPGDSPAPQGSSIARPSTSSETSSIVVLDPPGKPVVCAAYAASSDTPESATQSFSSGATPAQQVAMSPKVTIDDKSPLPKTKVVLMQGRPKPNEPNLYMIADGCGSVSNYIPLLAHNFSMPIYGIDSPFVRCPSRLTLEVGIPGVARHLVDALCAHQPSGPLVLGGYSGGATLAYEVARQLATSTSAGRLRVAGLLLLDMRCPLPPSPPEPLLSGELAWKVTQHAFALDARGAWNPEASTSVHLGRLFACVAAYRPPPIPEQFQCPTAIIWCAKGMIRRLGKYPELLRELVDHGMPTEAYPGFAEDPRLGHVVWGLLHKSEADIAPNGWERYVSAGRKDRILCLAIDSDHIEVVQSSHSHLTCEAMEKALKFLLRDGKSEQVR